MDSFRFFINREFLTAARNLFKMVHDADVAELADAPDLGSGGDPVQVRPLSSAPEKNPHLSTTSMGSFQRNKSLTGFVKYASCVKYCFAM